MSNSTIIVGAVQVHYGTGKPINLPMYYKPPLVISVDMPLAVWSIHMVNTSTHSYASSDCSIHWIYTVYRCMDMASLNNYSTLGKMTDQHTFAIIRMHILDFCYFLVKVSIRYISI